MPSNNEQRAIVQRVVIAAVVSTIVLLWRPALPLLLAAGVLLAVVAVREVLAVRSSGPLAPVIPLRPPVAA